MLADVDFAIDQDGERVAGFAFFHQHLAHAQAVPTRGAQGLPNLRVVERFEEGVLAQREEFFAVGIFFLFGRERGVDYRELIGEVLPGREALARILLQGDVDQAFQCGRQERAARAQRHMRMIRDVEHQRHQIVGLERPLAGQHFVDHHAQRKHVGTRVEFAFGDLLGRHVGWRADHAGQLRGLAVDEMRGAEVADLDVAALGQHDVFRLQVAVHQAARAGVGHRHATLEGDLQHGCHRQQRVGLDVVRQRHALDVFEHQVGKLLVLHGVEDAHDVGMLQFAHQARLVHEHVAHAAGIGRILQQVGLQDLDGHLHLLERVEGEIDVGGRSASQAAQDLIFVELFHACRGELLCRIIV